MKKFHFSDSRKINYNIISVLNSLHAKTETLTSVSGDKIWTITKENRICIRMEFRQSLGMNFVSPFQPEREFKVYNACKCSQIICSKVH